VKLGTLAMAATLFLPALCRAQAPAEAEKAFDGYVARAEARMKQEESSPGSFLHLLPADAADHDARAAKVKQGEVVIEKEGSTPTKVPDGLIHHWVGLAFVPKATIAQVLGVLQDYNNLQRYYSPEIVRSTLTMRRGDEFRSSMRLREHKVITVVLDADFEIQNGRLDPTHQLLASRSKRVVEIAGAGSPTEHKGENHGFLWQLISYWRFVQEAEGTFVECEAISLTRDVPLGLRWVVGPFIESVPRDSLQFTLTATRDGVLKNETR
jgi:hypothetical protein